MERRGGLKPRHYGQKSKTLLLQERRDSQKSMVAASTGPTKVVELTS